MNKRTKRKALEWGHLAVFLGVWESLAYAGKCPTISRTCWNAQQKYGRKVVVPIALTFAGVVYHLAKIPLDN
jgi:hypothetical protein